MKLNCSMLLLLRRRILVESVTISGLDLAVEQTKDQLLMGIAIPLGQEADGGPDTTEDPHEKAVPAFGVEALSIVDSTLSYHSVDLSGKAAITALELENLISWEPASMARLVVDLRVNGSPLQANAQIDAFSSEKRVDARIQLKQLSFEPLGNLAAAFVEDLHGYLDIGSRLSLSVSENGDLSIEQSGNIAVTDLKGMVKAVEGRGLHLHDMDMGWKGSSRINLSSDMRPIGISVSGELSNSHLRASLRKPEATIQHEGIHMLVSVISTLADLNTLSVAADISLRELLVTSDTMGIDVFSLGELDLQSIGMRGTEQIGITAIIAKDLAIGAPHRSDHPSIPASLIRSQKIEVADVQMNHLSDLMIDTIDIHQFAGSVYRNQKEELPLVKLLTRFAAPQTDATNEATQARDDQTGSTESGLDVPVESGKGQSIGMKINTVHFSGDNSVNFIDESLDPRIERLVSVDEISVESIDNSDINNSADLRLSLHVDKYASVETKGKIRPFHPKVDLDLEGVIRNVHLPLISPYLSKYMGYNIKTGVLSLDYVCKVDAGILDVGNEIVLKNIELIPDDRDKIDQLSKQLTMPLDTALSILRDKNNDVKLSIPITGDIENPDLNLNDIIGQALGKALKMASVSIIKNLLQPYGAIVTIASLAKKGGEYLTEIQIDPISFDIGSGELTVQATDYLVTVKNLMSEKKEMRLTICGRTVPGDLPNLTVEGSLEDFLSLANQRALIIQDYFVSRGITVERLFVCNPEVDFEEGSEPKAMLSL